MSQSYIQQKVEELNKKFNLSINQGGETLITAFDGEFLEIGQERVLEIMKTFLESSLKELLETVREEMPKEIKGEFIRYGNEESNKGWNQYRVEALSALDSLEGNKHD